MPYFDGASGRVFYRHWATDSVPSASLIFLHGFGEHSGLYHRLGAELGARGIELWALDQPGHGLSEGARGDVGSFEDVIANGRALSELAGAESAGVPQVLAGHSLGSVAALLSVLDDPDRYRALVISGAPLSPLAWLAEAVDGGRFALDLDALSADPFYRDELTHDPLAFTEADVVGTLAAIFGPAWQRFDAELSTIALPVLAVHGADDQIAPVEGVTAWRNRLPALHVEVVADAAHDVLNEVAHARVAALVAEHVLAHVDAGVAA